MGTSDSIKNATEIIREQLKKYHVAVVVSATSGTTDLLIQIGQKAMEKKNWKLVLAQITDKHEGIAEELNLKINFTPFRSEISEIAQGVEMLGELSAQTLDLLQSFGERMSATILAAYINKIGISSKMVDAKSIIFADNNYGCGNVNFQKTDKACASKLLPMMKSGIVPVITGFIAQSIDKKYITLGRGGSDYTCGIIAAALKSTECQIWTDVDGIYNTAPGLVKQAKPLEQISFNEAQELAYFGAKVLHPKTIQPAIKKGIPVRILNTFNPSAKGTIITAQESHDVKSVTYKKGITIVNIISSGMLFAHGFLAKLFDVFAKNNIVLDVIATSEISVSVTADKPVPQKVISELKGFADVELFENMAIVCLVGGGLRDDNMVLGRLFTALSGTGIRMISQGASKRNITFLVKEEFAEETVKKVFAKFFINQ